MLDLVAHRGASLEAPENTLASLELGASLGAHAVECDVRRTLDGVYVIYHDGDLSRLTKCKEPVSQVTAAEMSRLLEANGRTLMTLRQLLDGYGGGVPVLLHIKLKEPEEVFLQMLRTAKISLIAGVQSLEMLCAVREFLPREQILAFVPKKDQWLDYAREGAGIIRLWENWLDQITPDEVRARYAVRVYVMALSGESMNGSEASLDRLLALHADGVLLNDIRMGVEWARRRQ